MEVLFRWSRRSLNHSEDFCSKIQTQEVHPGKKSCFLPVVLWISGQDILQTACLAPSCLLEMAVFLSMGKTFNAQLITLPSAYPLVQGCILSCQMAAFCRWRWAANLYGFNSNVQGPLHSVAIVPRTCCLLPSPRILVPSDDCLGHLDVGPSAPKMPLDLLHWGGLWVARDVNSATDTHASNLFFVLS